jgi:hypothetical protein
MERRAERAQGYRREAEKCAKLAKSGQLWPTLANSISQTCTERLRSGMLGWRKIWSEGKNSLTQWLRFSAGTNREAPASG